MLKTKKIGFSFRKIRIPEHKILKGWRGEKQNLYTDTVHYNPYQNCAELRVNYFILDYNYKIIQLHRISLYYNL